MAPIAGAGHSPLGCVESTHHILGSSGERGLGERSGIGYGVLVCAMALGRCGVGVSMATFSLSSTSGAGPKCDCKTVEQMRGCQAEDVKWWAESKSLV